MCFFVPLDIVRRFRKMEEHGGGLVCPVATTIALTFTSPKSHD